MDEDDTVGYVLAFIAAVVAVASIVSCDMQHDLKVKARQETKQIEEKYKTDVLTIKDKYNSLSCQMRGLTVEQVEGIKLCMDPQTRSLHKIDEVKDSK